MEQVVWLEDRGIVSISGDDAASFLQGLVTNDVETLVPGKACYAALLTPQGKILFDFLIVRGEKDFVLDCTGEQAATLAKRLGFYRLRSKVTISDQSAERVVLAHFGDAPPTDSDGLVYADPRAGLAGARSRRGAGRRRHRPPISRHTIRCALRRACRLAASILPMAMLSLTTPTWT